MSEQEKQQAIAKIQAQGCRRWMSLLIIAPVLLCATLVLIAPTVRNMLARNQANEYCATLPGTIEPVYNSTLIETDAVEGETEIGADNLEQMVLFSEGDSQEVQIPSRDYIPAVSHPGGDYVIYAEYRPSYATTFYICDNEGNASGAFTGDETAREIVFNNDGSLFAVSDGRFGRIKLYDGMEIHPVETINVRGNQEYRQIDSIAFHPTQSLIFFTSEDELFVYELDNYTEIFRVPVFETNAREIAFNADGTLFFMGSTREDAPSYTWGVRD